MRVMPCGGEEAAARVEERRAGRGFLVGQDLGVGQPGVVVDSGVDVVEPDLCWLAAGRWSAAVDPPPAAVGDAAELLHIDVDQIAGSVAFVAGRCRLGGADRARR